MDMIALGHLDKPAACLVKVCIPLNPPYIFLFFIFVRACARFFILRVQGCQNPDKHWACTLLRRVSRVT